MGISAAAAAKAGAAGIIATGSGGAGIYYGQKTVANADSNAVERLNKELQDVKKELKELKETYSPKESEESQDETTITLEDPRKPNSNNQKTYATVSYGQGWIALDYLPKKNVKYFPAQSIIPVSGYDAMSIDLSYYKLSSDFGPGAITTLKTLARHMRLNCAKASGPLGVCPTAVWWNNSTGDILRDKLNPSEVYLK